MDPRIYEIDAEMRLLLSNYNMLKNITTIPAEEADKNPATLKSESILSLNELLEKNNVPKTEWVNLRATLPNIGAGYISDFNKMINAQEPDGEAAYKFVLQSICKAIVELSESKSDLLLNFAKREITLILQNQKLFARPGNFNWSVFEFSEEDIDDEVGDIGEDIMEEMVENQGEEDTYDPFSGEGMDYDTSENNPNNEP
jgi:hypothetical protein